MTLFSDRVEAWLEEREWTRYRLASEMGGPGAEDQLRKWLRGDHEPSGRSVRRVAQALGITEGQFWGGPNAPGAAADRRRDPLEIAELDADLAEAPEPEELRRASGAQDHGTA